MSKEACVLAIDAGTTSVRTLAIDSSGRVRTSAARELTQYFPRPGWVEHDADEIWRTTVETLRDVTDTLGRDGTGVAAIGITNQRETIVVWDPTTGRPRGRAIVWQDRRTAGRCDELRALGREPLVRERTGLVPTRTSRQRNSNASCTRTAAPPPPRPRPAPSTASCTG